MALGSGRAESALPVAGQLRVMWGKRHEGSRCRARAGFDPAGGPGESDGGEARARRARRVANCLEGGGGNALIIE